MRALGTGQVRLRDLPAILTKELSTGVLIAVAMAAAAMIRAWTLAEFSSAKGALVADGDALRHSPGGGADVVVPVGVGPGVG